MLPGLVSALAGAPSRTGPIGYKAHAANFIGGVAQQIPVSSLTVYGGGSDSLLRGDYVIVVASLAHNLAATPSFSISATGVSFTSLQSASIDASNDLNCHLWGALISGTPPSTIDVTFVSGSDRPCEVLIMVFRGVDQVTPQDATIVEVTSSSSAAGNPGTITPTQNKSIVVAILCASYDATANGSISTYPYPDGQVVVYESDLALPEQMGCIAACYKTPVTGGVAENPQAFSFVEAVVGVSAAYTVAIRMA